MIERNFNRPQLQTGDIDNLVSELNLLNPSITPPFTVENDSDSGEELQMNYRYLNIWGMAPKEKRIEICLKQ